MNPTATATHPAAQNLTAVDGTFTGDVTITDDLNVGDDLLLTSDSSVIKLGADADVTITHDPDDGLIVKSTATADDNPLLLTLQTGETDLAANDVIGKIAFQAPDEGTGTDAVLVSAAIQAVAEGDHSSSSNATKLSFMTGASEAATEKMALSSGGALTVANGLTLTDGDVTVASGHGISFAATSDGTTATSEVLDDYEEGNWNATLTPQTSGSVTVSSDGCQYVKIGQIVHVSGIVQVNAVSSPDGVMRMGGFPFANANLDDLSGGTLATIQIQAAALPPYRYGMWMQEGDSTADIFNFTTGSDQPQGDAADQFGGNESIYFSLTYRTT